MKSDLSFFTASWDSYAQITDTDSAVIMLSYTGTDTVSPDISYRKQAQIHYHQ